MSLCKTDALRTLSMVSLWRLPFSVCICRHAKCALGTLNANILLVLMWVSNYLWIPDLSKHAVCIWEIGFLPTASPIRALSIIGTHRKCRRGVYALLNLRMAIASNQSVGRDIIRLSDQHRRLLDYQCRN